MEQFDPIEVEFLINNQEVAQSSKKVKDEIKGIGATADEMSKRVNKSIDKNLNQANKNQTDLLKNLRGEVKTVTQDAIQAFEAMDPATRRQINNLVLFENQIQQLKRAERELQADLKRGTITQGQYNVGLRGIRTEMARAQTQMSSLSREIRSGGQVMERAGAVSKMQFNGLQNSINQISRELPAFTYSAQTGFMAISNNIPILADEIGRLRVENQKLTASGQKAVPIWKQLVGGLLNWQTLLTVTITLMTVYGKEIGDWIMNLVRGKKEVDELISSQEALNKGFESSSVKDAIGEMFSLRANLSLAKDGFLEQQEVVDQYNESLGKVTGEVKSLQEAEDGITDNADKFVKATIYKAAALEAQEEIAKEMSDALKEQNRIEEELIEESNRMANMGRQSANTMPGMPFSDQQIQAARLNDLQKAHTENQELQEDIAESGGKIIGQLREMSLATGLNLFGSEKVKKAGKAVLDERERLLEKVAAIDAEYARMSLTSDEEEVQALRDKFARVRKLVQDFNNDPKNKTRQISLGALDAREEGAVGDLQFRQETNRLKDSLEEKKKLYQEYERTAADFGIQEAKRRYSAELDTSRTYLDLIRDEYAKLNSLPAEELSGPQAERLRLLEDELGKEQAAQDKQYDELLKSLQDYNQKRGMLTEKYLLEKQEMEEKGDTQYLDNLERQYQKEVNALDEAQIKKMAIFEQFFAGVDHMSTENAKKLVSDVRDTVSALREQFPELSKFFDEIEQKLGETEVKIGERITADVMQLSQAFRRLSQDIGGVNQGLSIMLRSLSESLARVAEVRRGMQDFRAAQAQGDGFGSVVAGAGVAGAVVGGIIQLSNVMKSANERQTAILKKQLDFQRQIYYGELEIEKLQRDRALEKAKSEQNTLDNLIAQRNALKENFKSIQAGMDRLNERFNLDISQGTLDQLSSYDINGWYSNNMERLMAELGDSLYNTGDTKTVRGGFLGLGKKEVAIYESLAGMSFEEIENLSIKGLLTEQAEKAFQALKALKEEGAEVEQQLEEIDNQLRDIFTGGASAGAIADSIIEGFRNGKRAVEDFGEEVEGILSNAILSGFKYRFLEAPLNDLLDQLYEDNQSEGGLDSSEIDRFTDAYNNITGSALDALKELEASTGINFNNQSSTQQGLSGAIRRQITEETGTELAGLFRGFYDISKRGVALNEERFALEKKCFDATMDIMQSSAKTAQNTADTVARLQEAVVELKAINKNTKQNSTGYDRGL